MTRFYMVALISCLSFSAFAGNDSQYRGEGDAAYEDAAKQDQTGQPDQSQDQTGKPNQGQDQGQGQGHRKHRRSRSGVWVCYADNLIVKGFIGVSSDKGSAMALAMARCENNSQLPCFAELCRQE